MFNSTERNKTITFLMTLIEFLTSVLIIHFIVVLFGASLFDFENTFLFSIFISLICVMPLLILIEHSNPVDLLFRVFIKQELNDLIEARCATISRGTLVGSWLGALVIPLDWDRWWQVFPIPCVFGAILGAVISSLTLVKFKNKIKKHY